jgi:hypothetical protein
VADYVAADLAWNCPHCQEFIPLDIVEPHVDVHHTDCWPCRREAMVADALLVGEGFIDDIDRMGFYRFGD